MSLERLRGLAAEFASQSIRVAVGGTVPPTALATKTNKAPHDATLSQKARPEIQPSLFPANSFSITLLLRAAPVRGSRRRLRISVREKYGVGYPC